MSVLFSCLTNNIYIKCINIYICVSFVGYVYVSLPVPNWEHVANLAIIETVFTFTLSWDYACENCRIKYISSKHRCIYIQSWRYFIFHKCKYLLHWLVTVLHKMCSQSPVRILEHSTSFTNVTYVFLHFCMLPNCVSWFLRIYYINFSVIINWSAMWDHLYSICNFYELKHFPLFKRKNIFFNRTIKLCFENSV